MSIIRGTTPTLRFTFSEINIADITTAILVIKQNDETIIEKPLSEAVVNEGYIDWQLTQEETFKLNIHKKAEICCDWKLVNGVRGRSHMISEWVERTGKNEVI